jgi:hypothetical protein
MATVGATIRKLQHYDPNDTTIEDLLEKPEVSIQAFVARFGK